MLWRFTALKHTKTFAKPIHFLFDEVHPAQQKTTHYSIILFANENTDRVFIEDLPADESCRITHYNS